MTGSVEHVFVKEDASKSSYIDLENLKYRIVGIAIIVLVN